MEKYGKERRKNQPDDTDHNKLQAELIEIREELYRAKDSAMQSWLDSKPLIDELEKLQAGLASSKNRTSMSNIVISELESQLEAISIEVRTKVEDETKAKEMINELSQALEEKYKESEAIKLDADEERRARSKLKQVLRIRTQTLRTLQLTLQAIRIESEAFGASAVDAVGHIKGSRTDYTVVRVGQGEYYALESRAKEKTALAEWRVSVSMEQKLAAEESRNFALSRLKELKRSTSKEEKIYGIKHVEEQQSSEIQENSRMASPKARKKAITNKSNRRKGIFLPPHSFTIKNGEEPRTFDLVDGGVAANNPTLLAITHVCKDVLIENPEFINVKTDRVQEYASSNLRNLVQRIMRQSLWRWKGTELLKKPESRVNLETVVCESIRGGHSNEAALTDSARRLSYERKLRRQQQQL
ncbi:conserved hypothetical protein [Ricinus communis]|uniref:PNPLA domain-containing protein n=1 Tax=Ricinus communis TaxID=3988 RepID=B9S8J8_RICCO|nr:conserved hypothetical protein [Ricinus communis]